MSDRNAAPTIDPKPVRKRARKAAGGDPSRRARGDASDTGAPEAPPAPAQKVHEIADFFARVDATVPRIRELIASGQIGCVIEAGRRAGALLAECVTLLALGPSDDDREKLEQCRQECGRYMLGRL